jgi:small-conductance mechanosensitive channel
MNFQEILEPLGHMLDLTLFKLNTTPITTGSILTLIVILFLFHIGSRLLERMIDKLVFQRVQMEEGTRYTLRRVMHYMFMSLGVLVGFQAVGIDLTGLAMVFGMLSVGIGFGLQNLTSNFISGLILLIEQPIKVGDRVTVGEIEGDVQDISIRSTTVNTLDNLTIIVPNSDFISARVINWSHGDRRVRTVIEVGVSYGSDLDLVLETLKEAAVTHPKVLQDPAPDVLLAGFGDSAWNMKLRVWLPDAHRLYVIRSEINCAIVRLFRERGIEIPFPQQDLHVRSSIPLVTRQNDNASA